MNHAGWPDADARCTLPDRSEVETAQTMAVWSDASTCDTMPPVSNAEPTARLPRLLALCEQRLTEAGAAVTLLDSQLEAHWKKLEAQELSAQRRTAAFAITRAFDAFETVVEEAERCGLQADVEAFQLAGLEALIRTWAARVAEGLGEHRLFGVAFSLKAHAVSVGKWREELEG